MILAQTRVQQFFIQEAASGGEGGCDDKRGYTNHIWQWEVEGILREHTLPVTGLIKTPDDSSSLSNKKYICWPDPALLPHWISWRWSPTITTFLGWTPQSLQMWRRGAGSGLGGVNSRVRDCKRNKRNVLLVYSVVCFCNKNNDWRGPQN